MKSSSMPSILGGTFLVAGSCIGAGMLALPVKAATSGLYPFLLCLLLAFLLMLGSGLALLEVSHKLKTGDLSQVAFKTLGSWGRGIVLICYIFLFYSLMVAYIAGTARIISYFLGTALSLESLHLLVASVIGLLILYGTRACDYFNRYMLIGLILAYIGLVSSGLLHIHVEYYEKSSFGSALSMFPVLIIMFGYHNLIPTLYSYYQGNIPSIRLAIILGCCLSLCIYGLWQVVVLGIIPSEGEFGLLNLAQSGDMVIKGMQGNLENSGMLVLLGQLFSLFAILTSFIGVGLGFIEFLRSHFNSQKYLQRRFVWVCLVFIPATLCSLSSLNVFITALDYAGAFGAAILFGVLPVIMLLRQRRLACDSQGVVFPFGIISLMVLGVCFAVISLYQLWTII